MSVRTNLIIAACFLVISASNAVASCDWVPGFGFPGVDGTVSAATTWDPDGPGPEPELLVVGGYFPSAGNVVAKNIAAWDGANWHALGGGTSGYVRAITVFNGELIAGGEFTFAGQNLVRNIARWNGSDWQPLGTGILGRVFSLTVYNGELIVGGDFYSAGSVSVNNIASWNGSTWQALGIGVGRDLFGSQVSALSVYGNDLIAGGYFPTAGGVNALNIARWNGSEWQSLDNGMNGSVYALAVHDSELIAGGNFTSAGSAQASRISRWNGSTWQSLGTGMSGSSSDLHVSGVSVFNGHLVAGGTFATAGGVTTNNIARWDGASWHALGTGVNSTARPLAVFQEELMVSVGPAFFGGVRHYGIVRWNGDTWNAVGDGLNGWVTSLQVFKDELVVSGSFTAAGGISANHIVRWNGATWQELGVGLDSGNSPYFPVAYDFAIYNGDLIAGGFFEQAGGISVNNIARWDGEAWHPLGVSGMNGRVYAVEVFHGELFAGGEFTTADGTTVNHVARWNGTTWTSLGSGMGGGSSFNRTVKALSVYQGELIAAGIFLTAGGINANQIARWNGNTWQPLGAGVSGSVSAIALYDGELIVGGLFGVAGGVGAPNIAGWNGTSWRAIGSGTSAPPMFTADVLSLGVFNGELFAGGFFQFAGGVSAQRIARWNGTEWKSFGAGMADGIFDSRVLAFSPYHGRMIVGGDFFTADGNPTTFFAQWGPTGSPGDFDGSGSTDLADFAEFPGCLSDPIRSSDALNTDTHCLCAFNSEGDGDVDLFDFATLQNAFLAE